MKLGWGESIYVWFEINYNWGWGDTFKQFPSLSFVFQGQVHYTLLASDDLFSFFSTLDLIK